MTSSPAHRAAAMALAAMALAACGPRAATPGGTPAPIGTQGDEAAVARARADSVRHPYTAADVHFMTVMIGHHAQAIAMARLAPTHGASPPVLRLAERIINAQQDEIATMQQWLRDRRKPVPEPGAMAGHDHGAHARHDAAAAPMPGMLTAAQMAELDAARETEFDQLFLTCMIRHHRGATEMVRQLFGSYGAGQDETVFKFASDVNVDQETEIARMQRMLRALQLEGAAR